MKNYIYIPIVGVIIFVIYYFTKNKPVATKEKPKSYADDAFSNAMFTNTESYKVTADMTPEQKLEAQAAKEEALNKAALRQEYFRLYDKEAPTYASADTLQKAIDDKNAYNATLKIYVTEVGDGDTSDNNFKNLEDIQKAIDANRYAEIQAYENTVLDFVKYSSYTTEFVKNKYRTIKDVIQAHNELLAIEKAWKETQVKVGRTVDTFIATINDRGTAFKNNAFNTEILNQLINYSDVYAAEAQRQYEVKGGVSMPDNYGGKSYYRGTMTACVGQGTATKYRAGNSTAYVFRDNYLQRSARGLFSKKITKWGTLI